MTIFKKIQSISQFISFIFIVFILQGVSIFEIEKCRDKLIQYLKINNVDSRPVFSPISQYPIWKKKYNLNKFASIIGSYGINLPSGTGLTKMEIKYICTKINDFFKEKI